MSSYADILANNFPDAEWAINGNDYESLVWLSDSAKPTKAELDALATTTDQLLLLAEAKNARSNAYRSESDPLFFGWQRGENTEQTWLDKVAEIRARYPYQA